MKQRSFFRQLMDVGLGTMLSIAIGVVTTPIITRMVEPVVYGEFALFNTYLTLGMSFVCLGLDQSFIRFFYEAKGMSAKRNLFIKCLRIPLLLWIIICGSIFLMSMSKGWSNNVFLMYCYALSLLVVVLNRFWLNWLRVNNESKLYAGLNCFTKFIYVFMTISLVGCYSNGNQLHIMVVANYLSVLIPTIIAIIKSCNLRKAAHRIKEDVYPKIGELLKYGLSLMLATSVFSIFQATDRLSLDYLCNPEVVGVYASAQSLMTVFAVIQQSFNIVWGAKAIEKYEAEGESKEYFVFVHRIMVLCMFFFGATVLLFKNIFVLLLGESYREAATIIPFLMLNPIMYTISETTNLGILLKKKSIYQVYAVILSCITNVIGNFILIPIVGAQGAAISTGISYIVLWGTRTVFSQKLMYIDYGIRKLLLVIVAFILMAYYHISGSCLLGEIVSYIIFVSILVMVYFGEIKEILEMLKRKTREVCRR